jgi:DNA-binding response OmpR family regulator
VAHDGLSALERFDAIAPAIVILDWEMPRMNGLDVCRTIRARATTPIIMLTVRDSDEDIVEGLSAGADDFITKPFSPVQLMARIQAVMRRSGAPAIAKPLTFANLSLQPERNTATYAKRPPIQLTQLEFKLLESLLMQSEQVVYADNLIHRVWGAGGGDRAMLKQLVYRLRKKIELDGDANSVYIETVPGIGYTLMSR